MRSSVRKIRRTELPPAVPIVSDGGIATSGTGDGRLIPVLIVDCDAHADLLRCIHMHEFCDPGDVDCTWGIATRGKYVASLLLSIKAPVETDVLLTFEGATRFLIADTIHRSKAVYIQPLEYGITVMAGLDAPKILLEIPPPLPPGWEDRLLKAIAADYRRRGLGRGAAKKAAIDHLEKYRSLARRQPIPL